MQAHLAMEGGCRWIQIPDNCLDGNEPLRTELSEKIIPDCQAHEAFLILENDIDMVDSLKVHGLFLRDNTRSIVMAARERLGAEAVLGVAAANIEEIATLSGLDVDYVTVPAPTGLEADGVRNFYAKLKAQADERAIGFHIVAEGDFSPASIGAPIEAGCSGVAVSASIADSPDPATATSALLDALARNRRGAED